MLKGLGTLTTFFAPLTSLSSWGLFYSFIMKEYDEF